MHTCWPSNPLSGIYQREINRWMDKEYLDKWPKIFIVDLYIMGINLECFKCLAIKDLLGKWWYSYTIEYMMTIKNAVVVEEYILSWDNSPSVWSSTKSKFYNIP